MEVLYLVILYILVVGCGAAIFLHGKPDGNSFFDKLYRLFVRHLPRALKFVLRKIFGQRGPNALDYTWNYLVWQCNPLVQAFYLVILSCGYLGFVVYAHPYLPNVYASEYHKYSGFVCVMSAFLFWLTCSFTDPGTITRRNARALTKVYPYDTQIFYKGNCTTCKTIKPARSKHCALCDICVCRFDHHCIWVNNCIGIGNHRLFLGFLLSHCVLTAYGATLGTLILLSIVKTKGLLTAVFIDHRTGEEFQSTYKTIIYFLVAHNNVIMFVTILCAVMSIVLFGFFLWHFNLVRIGETSNESSKWRNLKEYLFEHQHEDEEARRFLEDLHNSYNKGLIVNLKEVIFPIDVHEYVALPGESDATDDERETEEVALPAKETHGDQDLAKSKNDRASQDSSEVMPTKGKKSGRRRK